MKKLILLFLIILATGCEKEPFEEIKDIEEKPTLNESVVTYVDQNPLNIGLYTRSNGKYTLWTEYKTKVTNNKDINTFQIVPSIKSELTYQGRYVDFIEKLWNEITIDYKLGIVLEYSLKDNTSIKHVVYDPSNTLKYQDYFQVYLYDAIAHKNDKWYSHITNEEFSEDSFITSFKIAAGKKNDEVIYPIKLSVFTYDTEDDFDENNNYRGKSIYSINIIDE